MQIRKATILSKIVNFIKGLFRPKYKAINQHNPISTSLDENTQDFELINLQDKFENNQIKLSELSDNQLQNLNNLYQNQIKVLKQTLNYKKIEMNINEQILN